jgi:DNA-binding beta-propeller fold protein YncE
MRLSIYATMLALGSFQQAPAEAPLRLIRTIELPRVEGRIDHLAADSAHERLFVAALGNNTVEVIDLRAGKVSRSLPGFHEPQGIVLAPEANAIAVANGGSGALQLLDIADQHVVKTVPLGGDADNVRYEAATKRLYVGYGNGALGAVDALNGARLGDARLAAHPESFQLEANGPRIFVNVPTAGHIAVVDRTSMKVVSTWPVAGASANFPMALDEADHRLFVGCRSPAKVLVFDTSSGRVVGSFDIVGDTDDLFYDAARKRLYVSGGDGFIDVIQPAGGDRFTRIGHLATAAGARTSLFVAQENRLYVAVPHRGAQRAEIRVYETR